MGHTSKTKINTLSRQLDSSFGKLFHTPCVDLPEQIRDLVKSVNEAIYGIQLTPNLNDEWTIIMFYKNETKLISVDLHTAPVDVDAWFNDVSLSAKLFVQRVDEVERTTQKQTILDLIVPWIKEDTTCAEKTLKRLHADKNHSKDDATKQYNHLRQLYISRSVLIETLCKRFNTELLTQELNPYLELYPYTCQMALNELALTRLRHSSLQVA